MLVLTRRVGQPIVIVNPHTGDTYEVTVVEVKGGQVRLGVAAPRDVTLDRSEVAERKRVEPDPALGASRQSLRQSSSKPRQPTSHNKTRGGTESVGP